MITPTAPSGSVLEPCLLDNICTDLQSSELGGLNCELVEPVAPATDGSQSSGSTVSAPSPDAGSSEAPTSGGGSPCVSLFDPTALIDYPDGYDLSC